ncbi:hypothetical protein [Actinomycetospora sp. CA-053990]|uniref:hypothetical protein n=1 Tax=Actinomycetospora sp. CA-053990 TaxID=3239891 RepID=UPI003D8CDA8D
MAASDSRAGLGEVLAASGLLVGRELDEAVLAPAVAAGLLAGITETVRFAHPCSRRRCATGQDPSASGPCTWRSPRWSRLPTGASRTAGR